MNRVGLSEIRLGRPRFSGLTAALRWAVFGLFLLNFALVYVRLWQPAFLLGTVRWPEGLLLVLTTATLLASLTAQLPAQNVMLISIIIALVGGAVHTLGALTGIPFGPFAYTEHFGQKLFEPLPWAVPMLWLVAILASRGVARLVLRPWRKVRTYGFWLIGVTVGLVVLFELSLEPFATQVQGYWAWHPTKLKLEWYSAPCVNFLGWALTAALILAFITPPMLNKKPVKHLPQYQPLMVWLLLNGLLATSAALHQFWPAFWVTAGAALAVALLAAYGARER